MKLDLLLFRDGRREPLGADHDLSEAIRQARESDGFVWLGIGDPTVQEMAEVSAVLGIPALGAEDALDADEHPKLELFGEELLIVLRSGHYDDEAETVRQGGVQVFLGAHHVVTIRHGDGDTFQPVRDRLDREPELLSHGPSAVLYAVLDLVVDGYGDAQDGIEVDIDQVEQEVFSGGRSNPSARIYGLERALLHFHRAVRPLLPAVEAMASGKVMAVDESLRHGFRDVHDHLRRLDSRLSGSRELLSSILQANLAQISIRQGDDARRISAWAAIAVVPTMIAGIYGMNFEHMPELHWRFGYPLALGLMLAICLGLYWRLRRAGWL